MTSKVKEIKDKFLECESPAEVARLVRKLNRQITKNEIAIGERIVVIFSEQRLRDFE